MSEDLIKRSDVMATIEKRKAKIVSNCESDKWFRKMISEVEAIPSADTFEITKEALIEAIDNAETVGDVVENIIDRPQGESILKDTIQRLERVIKHGVVGKDGMHPVSAEVMLNWLKGADDEP